jgi:hypothetical protein
MTLMLIPEEKRFGVKVYASSPFLDTKIGAKYIGRNPQDVGIAQIYDADGVHIGDGCAIVAKREMTDRASFQKFFVEAMTELLGLKSAGREVLLYLITKVPQATPDWDLTVALTYLEFCQDREKSSLSTFNRGLKDLIDHNFIARSRIRDFYFLNHKYLFNGNRLIVAKIYEREVEQ